MKSATDIVGLNVSRSNDPGTEIDILRARNGSFPVKTRLDTPQNITSECEGTFPVRVREPGAGQRMSLLKPTD
jgi:hypothetical protein